MSHHQDTPTSRFRIHATVAAKVLATAFGLAVLIQVSWNMFAPDLLSLPELRIKQALGLVGFGYAVAVLLRHAASRTTHG